MIYLSEPDPKVTVGQDSDVVLPCSLSTEENTEFKLFDWKKVAQKDDGLKEVFLYDGGIHYNNGLDGQSEEFKGRVSHFPDELKYGDASIIIRNTTISDNGVYTCAFPRLQPPQTFYIELVVVPVLKDRSGENIPGSAPKPSITSLKETKDWRLLQCEVQGKPKPEVKWQDSDGNNLPAEKPQVTIKRGLFSITLNTTVTKSDRYRCVAKQEKIRHQVSAEIDVYIHGPTVITVEGGTDVMLPCSLSTKENITSKLFDWKKVAQKDDGLKEVFLYDGGSHYNNGLDGQSEEFKGRVSHFPDELKDGNASIIIRNTTLVDSGDYTCYFPNLQPPQTFYIDLVVASPNGWIVAGAVLAVAVVVIVLAAAVLLAKYKKACSKEQYHSK
ncbi:CD276 antigen-like [Sander lucioperca]|uniref:CD276 antigen-like n=1 Tax=Sander lucioperca TaxID=283035 RepID=UPI001653AA17|nr:CD276 antigen-like [Sander lucioperca]